jgi:4-hydroxy-4-methyl-2-oxoglutarate aldolase
MRTPTKDDLMFHVMHSYRRLERELVDAFSEVAVATAHEAYDKRGAMAAAIKPLRPGMRACGTALTVKLQAGDNLMLHKALDIVAPGDVLVVDVESWEGGPWGELMTVIALARGAAGLVIDGFVRDASEIAQLGFPVFARGSSVKGTFKHALGFVNHPVSCGGVLVEPGDLVFGDEDGVCAVSRRDAAWVLEAARAREREEAALRERFRAGESLWDVGELASVGQARGMTEEPAQ